MRSFGEFLPIMKLHGSDRAVLVFKIYHSEKVYLSAVGRIFMRFFTALFSGRAFPQKRVPLNLQSPEGD